MKTLIVLVALLVGATSIASPSSSEIRQDRLQKRAQKLFDSMSPAEALANTKGLNKFSTRKWNQYMPGTSTWFGPGSLCLDGDTINTVKPVEVCTEWSVEYKYGFKDPKVFKSRVSAEKFADSDDAKGKAFCSDSYLKEVSIPLNYTVQGCVKWQVKTTRFGYRKYKTFTSKASAERFADSSSIADGSPKCVEEGTINKSMPTMYKVDFYRNTRNDDKDTYLGSYKYMYQSCDAADALPPVQAN